MKGGWVDSCLTEAFLMMEILVIGSKGYNTRGELVLLGHINTMGSDSYDSYCYYYACITQVQGNV